MLRYWHALRTAFRSTSERKRIVTWAMLVMLQAISATFFVGDVFADYMSIGLDPHTSYEALATLALILGVFFGSAEMWQSVSRQLRAEKALRLAAGAFAEIITERFNAWSLSPAEAEVALLTLKGFDTKEIAVIRHTAHGTVRVQLANIYTKSGHHNRGQFVSSFLDGLLEKPVAHSEIDAS